MTVYGKNCGKVKLKKRELEIDQESLATTTTELHAQLMGIATPLGGLIRLHFVPVGQGNVEHVDGQYKAVGWTEFCRMFKVGGQMNNLEIYSSQPPGWRWHLT